ncbi:amino acid adenylation domain-containing protein [Streptomyces sp. NPDC057199]|uniref:amino acid adenylation domain-containing protein n=1 Tax=Streptomyces sp. NPDC057199 TaxID=3346047 RepID=UPI00363A703B
MPLEDLYPLSALQQGLLFETLADSEGARYVQQIRWRAEGPLDARRYRSAWQRVVDRHAVLRTFVASGDGGEPLQAVLASAALPVTEQDWRGMPEAERDEQLELYCRTDRARGIVPETAPLCRLSLIRLGESTWESVWTFHHLLLDGWSIGRLINELGPLYLDPGAELPEPPPYRDYIAWLADQDTGAAHAHWRSYLDGFDAPVPLSLPTGDPGTQEPVAECTHVLEQRTEERLRKTARRIRATPGVLVQAAWAVVLSRYTDRDDIVFGTTVSGRPPSLPRVEEMVGLFINTVPVRARTRPGMTAAELVRKLQSGQLDREPYEHTSLYDIGKETELPPGTALFDTLCIYENYPVSAPFPDERIIPDVDLVQGRNTEITNYALTISVVPQDRLRIFASFDPRRFDPSAVQRLLGHYAKVLDQIAEDPERPLDRIALADPAERALLRRWTTGPTLDVPSRTVHDLVEQTAVAHPDRVAVVDDATGRELTYRQLTRRADLVAGALVDHGVKAGDLVGVCLPRGPELVTALLGVLRAGAAYLPLRPELPRARLEFMIEDARPTAVVGCSGADAPTGIDIDLVALGLIGDAVADPVDTAVRTRLPRAGADSLAYCLYTSGSTGHPKGVLIEHRGLVNRLAGMQESHRLRAEDSVLHKTPLDFDVSAWELFWPLITGARLVLAAPHAHQDPVQLARTIERRNITVTHFVPSLLAEFVRIADAGQLRSLRLVVCSGEVLPSPVARRLTELCEAELYNLYGPTEASIDVCAHRVRRPVTDALLPIGRPVHNTELHVLDHRMEPVPIGATGELCIGGVQLARGYLRRPELTGQRFPVHPYEPGQRLYRTGDLARWRADGVLDFLGRADHQVKLNGMRVEPGEIEHTLMELDGIAHALVSVSEGRLHVHLVADGERPDVVTLRAALARTLPDHMIPSAWHWLDSLPTLPNGKADRSRILASAGTAAQRSTRYTVPRGGTEELVARVWREILGVERVGAHDDFRELGGGSLDLVKIAFRLREELGRPVELRELVRHSTVAALAATLDGRVPDDDTPWSAQDERLDLPERLPARATTRSGDVLLTGATGFLGAFLLTELLARAPGRIHCLVRAGSEDDARKRLEENLRRYGLSVPADRLHPVPGDLGRPRLDLTAEDFERLGARLGLIVHAGARVDMLASYDQLAPVNIGGTRELLRLATAGRLTPLHYVSTGDPKDELVRSHVGYGLTKWRAERLVDAAREAGVPAGIIRLPRLTGDTRRGMWNHRDLAVRLLQLVLETGAAPPLGIEEWVPVDEAARLIASTALAEEEGGLFTVTAQQPVSLDGLIELIRSEGRTVAAVSGEEWETTLAERFPLEHELLRALAEESPAEHSPQSIADWGVLPQDAFTALPARGVDEALLRRYATQLSSQTTPWE